MKSDPLDIFIGEILDKKEQVANISPRVRHQLVRDLKERLLNQINRALVDSLPHEKIADFNSLLDHEDLSDTQVQEFIRRSGVDVEGTTLQAMLRFSERYLGRHEPIKESASAVTSRSNVAGLWLKTVDERQFLIELREDHTLLEALKESPKDTWAGTWGRGAAFDEDLDDSDFSIGIKIGKQSTMLRRVDDEHLSGIERNDDTNPSISAPRDGRGTSVELSRIRENLR